jgi:hypothetical protein
MVPQIFKKKNRKSEIEKDTVRVSGPRLMSQFGSRLEVVCAWIRVFLKSERWRFQCPSAYVVAEIKGLK